MSPLRVTDRVGVALLAALLLGLAAPAARATSLSASADGAVLAHSGLHLLVTLEDAPSQEPVALTVTAEGRTLGTTEIRPGETAVVLPDANLAAGRHVVELAAAGTSGRVEVRAFSGWLSIVPPLVAIGLALLFKDVLVSLFVGILTGCFLLFGWNPFTAFGRAIDHFVAGAVADHDRASILVFTTLLGGMVGLITRSGGTHGIVERLQRYATSPRRGQLATWVLGLLVFFDDYANTLIVGSTMRPITDRLRVSREKLAYMVDATAAPVASIAPISSWIGFEVGLIAAAFTALDLPLNAYTTFVASIPFRFYPIFALIFGLTIAATGRDFGPMLTAERRASRTGKVLADDAVPLADFGAERLAPPDHTPKRARNAFLPILAVMAVAVVGMYLSGSAGLARGDYASEFEWLREVFSNADSYAALLWASLSGVIVAAALPLLQKILSVREAMEGMVEGFKSMLMALVVLVLAWSIGSVCDELHTADFVVGLTADVLSPHWLPVLVFLISALVAFATGTSWGTLGILMPLVVPIAHGLSSGFGMAVGSPHYMTIMVGTVSSVLAGSVWGDHCSPISDTTILSSTASGCDHIAHVRTQLPYALGVGVLGMLIGDIPTAFGMSPWLSLFLGTGVIIGGVLWLGRSDATDD
ncbi:MAG: Na+/H+ antiporter NhaC family protein [Thermoanaerobaculia bacterium]